MSGSGGSERKRDTKNGGPAVGIGSPVAGSRVRLSATGRSTVGIKPMPTCASSPRASVVSCAKAAQEQHEASTFRCRRRARRGHTVHSFVMRFAFTAWPAPQAVTGLESTGRAGVNSPQLPLTSSSWSRIVRNTPRCESTRSGAGALALLDDAFDRGDGAGLIGDRTESREVGESGTDLTGAITEEQLPMVELGDERLAQGPGHRSCRTRRSPRRAAATVSGSSKRMNRSSASRRRR